MFLTAFQSRGMASAPSVRESTDRFSGQEFPKTGGTFLGVPIVRVAILLGLFGEVPYFGTYSSRCHSNSPCVFLSLT